MPRPLLHPFLAPSSPVLTNGRCTNHIPMSPGYLVILANMQQYFFVIAWSFLHNKSNSQWVNVIHLAMVCSGEFWFTYCSFLGDIAPCHLLYQIAGTFNCGMIIVMAVQGYFCDRLGCKALEDVSYMQTPAHFSSGMRFHGSPMCMAEAYSQSLGTCKARYIRPSTHSLPDYVR
jgi:hypothetical protein